MYLYSIDYELGYHKSGLVQLLWMRVMRRGHESWGGGGGDDEVTRVLSASRESSQTDQVDKGFLLHHCMSSSGRLGRPVWNPHPVSCPCL